MAYPTLSPRTAAHHAVIIRMEMLNSPREARSAPAMRRVSPGMGTPKSSRKIATKTAR